MNIAKNALRTYLGLSREKNKNIKALPKKRSSYKKKVYISGAGTCFVFFGCLRGDFDAAYLTSLLSYA